MSAAENLSPLFMTQNFTKTPQGGRRGRNLQQSATVNFDVGTQSLGKSGPTPSDYGANPKKLMGQYSQSFVEGQNMQM